MQTAEFQKLVTVRLAECQRVLMAKGAEYSSEQDKLQNFKDAAALKGETPERALWGMNAKHIIAIQKIIYDIDAGIVPDARLFIEKIGDNICYLLLLEALLWERHFSLPSLEKSQPHPAKQDQDYAEGQETIGSQGLVPAPPAGLCLPLAQVLQMVAFSKDLLNSPPPDAPPTTESKEPPWTP